jgi:hypothetical protein
MGKDMEGVGRDLTEVLSQQLPGGTEETLEKLSLSVRCLDASVECSPRAFSVHQPAAGTLLQRFRGTNFLHRQNSRTLP